MNVTSLVAQLPLQSIGSALKQRTSRVVYGAGGMIFQAGDPGDFAYLIEDGYVEISAISKGERQVVAILGPGEIFGEMAPIEEQVRTATATALHNATVVPITRDQLEAAVTDTNPLVQLLLRSALSRLRDTHQTSAGASVTSEQARERYESVRSRAATQIQLQRELEAAIEGQELELAYQPIISMADGRTAGYEALIRWRRPDGSVVSPGEFIPLAEESGLIIPMGHWVLETALVAMTRLHRYAARLGKHVPVPFVSINVSPKQLEAKSDVEQFARTIEQSGVDANLLKLEVTEGIFMRDPATAAAALARLKGAGIRIALDDFGVGYSSLSYLHRYPIDTLKIDRSFVDALMRDQGARRVVTGILSMAQALEMDVVAEGIERMEEFHWLQNRGCEYGQGFLMARPEPFASAQKHLSTCFEF